MFSENTISILKANGWNEDRLIDISNFEKYFEKNGLLLYNKAKSFLQRFGGIDFRFLIPLNKSTYHFYFNPISIGIHDLKTYVEDTEIECGKKLLPIGEFDNRNMTCFMDEEGRVYSSSDTEIELFANSGEEFIEYICTRFKGKSI